MKYLVLLLGLSFSLPSFAKFGAGIVLGDPSALSGKYWNQSNTAIDMGLGWDDGDNFFVFSDYLFHFPDWLAGVGHGTKLMPYIGVGGLLKIYSDDNDKRKNNDDKSFRLVVRIPVGLEWLPNQIPVGFFIEIVPGLRLYPDTDSDVGAGIGARFYF